MNTLLHDIVFQEARTLHLFLTARAYWIGKISCTFSSPSFRAASSGANTTDQRFKLLRREVSLTHQRLNV